VNKEIAGCIVGPKLGRTALQLSALHVESSILFSSILLNGLTNGWNTNWLEKYGTWMAKVQRNCSAMNYLIIHPS